MLIGSDQMIIQLNEGLLNLLFGYPRQLSHQDHKRKKDLGHNPSKFMGEKDVLSSKDGKDEEEASGNHKKYQNGEG